LPFGPDLVRSALGEWAHEPSKEQHGKNEARRGEPSGSMNDAERYMRWLEEMWDVHKLDPHGSTEREEKRKEEVLEMLEGLGTLAKRRVGPPDFPPS
jgi:hypothetical protein